MSLIAPLFLLGLAAAAVPLVIHLLGKRRAPIRGFAALDFVLRSNRKLARRLRVRRRVLLAARVALVAGVALMLARPYLGEQATVPTLGTAPGQAVLLLDDTLSMRRQLDRRPLFELARRRALDLVDSLGGNTPLALLTLTDPRGPLPRPSRDPRTLRRTLARLRVGQAHATAQAAVDQAARTMTSNSLKKHIFFISDMAIHTIGSSPLRSPDGVTLIPIDVAPEAAANIALAGLRAEPESRSADRAVRIQARICAHQDRGDAVPLTLAIDGTTVARATANVAARSCASTTFNHTFADNRWHRVTVSSRGDSLPDDDQRQLLVRADAPIRVLLVNGAPSAARRKDELFYLRSALSSGGSPAVRTSEIAPTALATAPLSRYHLVVLCNVAAVSAGGATALGTFVRRGGGLLLAPGDNSDAATLNRELGSLLPRRVRGIRTPPGDGLRLGKADTRHPLARRLYGGSGETGLSRARFRRLLALEQGTGPDTVLLAFDEGSPALVEHRSGKGRILLWTSTLDLDWNDLPLRPGFLPLVHQLVRHLAGAAAAKPRAPVTVGSRVSLSMPPQTTQVRLHSPGGSTRRWAAADLPQRKLELTIGRAGFHHLEAMGPDQRWSPLPGGTLVGALDPAESDLRKARLPKQPLAGSGTGQQRKELWHGVGALLLLLLLAEAALTFRS